MLSYRLSVDIQRLLLSRLPFKISLVEASDIVKEVSCEVFKYLLVYFVMHLLSSTLTSRVRSKRSVEGGILWLLLWKRGRLSNKILNRFPYL